MSKSNYFVVGMPVNSNDEGPVKDEEAVKVWYQIWDEDFVCVAEYETFEEAEYQCSLLNQSI